MRKSKVFLVWAIILAFICCLFIIVDVLCVVKPTDFGESLVIFYEDMTNEVGLTADDLYGSIGAVSGFFTVLLFIGNQVCLYFYIKNNKLEASTKDSKEVIMKDKKAVEKKEKKHLFSKKVKVVETVEEVKPVVKKSYSDAEKFMEELNHTK